MQIKGKRETKIALEWNERNGTAFTRMNCVMVLKMHGYYENDKKNYRKR